MSDEGLPIVIDNGSSTIKVGFAENTDEPDFRTFPSIVGSRINQKDSYVGYEAQGRRAILTLKHPIERGIITNWDDMEKIWHHAFNKELRVTPDGRAVLLTEATSNTKANREKMTEMFEKFQTSSMCVGNQARLSLISSGREFGIVLESGDGITQVSARYGGSALSDANVCLNFAGRDLTDLLSEALSEKQNLSFTREVLEDIKNTSCYVALDYEEELSRKPKKSYRLPDGKMIEIAEESFTCPETLLKPSKTGRNNYGIHAIVYKSIMSCKSDVQKDLFRNIVLTGGNMMYPGMVERMEKEITALVPSTVQVKVAAPFDGQKVSAWIGGCIIASVSFCEWVSKREYEESGPSIVHNRVF